MGFAGEDLNNNESHSDSDGVVQQQQRNLRV